MPNYQKILPIIFFLLPVLFIPLTPNIFGTPKELLLVIALLVTGLFYAFRAVKYRSLTVSTSPLRFGLAGFAAILILNLAIHPEGRLEVMIGTGGTYLLLCLWSYLLTLHTSQPLRRNLVQALLGASSLLALYSLLQTTLLFNLKFLPVFMQTRGFTLTGNSLTTLFFLIFGFTTTLILISKSTHSRPHPLLVFLAALHAVALISLGFLLLPGQELAVSTLPLTASWSIALDSLKSFPSFFLGVGLGNFANFAATVKPLFLNSTVFWNQGITSSGSELLQILTTTGLIGLILYLFIPFLVVKFLRSHPIATSDPFSLVLVTLALISGLILVFFSGTLLILFVFFTAIGLLTATPARTQSLTKPTSILVGLSLGLLTLLLGYYSYLVYAGEWHIARAQAALIKNDGKTVYEQNLAAIRLLPSLTSYHLSYSQVNLSLASALSQKTPLSDTDHSNIAQLVSQAVNEGKIATSLRPHESATWQNLGSIYRNLINVADGADQFAISAYAQAVTLDPGNPALRVEYGGLLYQLGVASSNASDRATLFSRAQSELQTAINLKPDYANAYYNLSKLLETTKDYPNAYLAMQKALSLLGPDSPDLSKATSELDRLKAKLPQSSTSTNPTPTPTESPLNTKLLTEPAPLTSPISGGKIPLPSANP